MKSQLVACALVLVAGSAWLPKDSNASEPTQVVALRLSSVPLFDRPNGAKIAEIRQEALVAPWPVLQQQANGFLEVDTPNGRAWVKRYAVQTNARISIPAECGAVVAGATKRGGVTRGLGEECQ